MNYFPLSRIQLRLVVELDTGHENRRGFQHRIRYAVSPECANDDEDNEEALIPIARDCPAHAASRRKWFGYETVLPQEIREFSIRQILVYSSAVGPIECSKGN